MLKETLSTPLIDRNPNLQNFITNIEITCLGRGFGNVQLPIGYFANVIDVRGTGIAISTDGVGSKTLIAAEMNNYSTIGIDCVANCVNDLLCVGATPLSFVDYIAVEKIDTGMLERISQGLQVGAELANISISGGEIAHLPDNIHGFDLSGTAIGRVDLDQVITGKNIVAGDLVIGVKSNGLHSNGYTLARKVFFQDHPYNVESHFAGIHTTLGEELLRPTDIYVKETLEIFQLLGLKAIINITGNGLLNLYRVTAQVGFILDNLFTPPPIFMYIHQLGNIPWSTMYKTFNMGIGFIYIVSPETVAPVLAILNKHGRQATCLGHAVADPQRKIHLMEKQLMSKNGEFIQLRF